MTQRLAGKLLIAVITLSAFFTLIITCIQLFVDYRKDVSEIDDDLVMIEKSYIPSIVSTRYNFDNEQARLLLQGIVKLKGFEYAAITEPGYASVRIVNEAGNPKAPTDLIRTFPLAFSKDGQDMDLGTLSVHVSLANAKQRVWDRVLIIVLSNAVKTFLMSLFILWILNSLVIRPLDTIAEFTRNMDIGSCDRKLVVPRQRLIPFRQNRVSHSDTPSRMLDDRPGDELDAITDAMNRMVQRIKADVETVNTATAVQMLLNRELAEKNERLNREIEEKLKAEKALKASEAKYKDLYNKAPNAYLSVSAEDGAIVNGNETVLGWLGVNLETLLRTPFPALFSACEESAARIHSAIVTLRSGTPVRDIDARMTVEGGHFMWVSIGVDPVFDAQGRVVEGRFALSDITNRKTLETRLQQAQKMEVIGNLAGGIAHDFNNILFPIVGLSEMLLDDMDASRPERESVEQIFKAGLRGRDLARQILSISRQSEQNIQPTDMGQVIREVADLARKAIPANIGLELDIHGECGLINADAGQLHQIVMNLIMNAYHAVEPSGGMIRVSLAQIEQDGNHSGGRRMKLTVSDNGCGIDPAVKERIFEPYFTTKASGKGTGLGLSVVYGIVKHYSGHIDVESEPGKGTSFHVWLPIVNTEEKPVTTGVKDRTDFGSERILVVDDEDVIARLEKQILERMGYRVTALSQSAGALKAVETDASAFDLIITDMTMPSMTGDLLAEAVMEINPDVPVILCTGFSERLTHQAPLSPNIKGVLIKPIMRNELSAMVRKVLDETKKTAAPG